MIINVRGTSGSGKSTLVRALMELYKDKQSFFRQKRRQPLYYRLNHPSIGSQLYVIGHYETPCGGTDTINKLDDIFELIKNLSEKGDVIFEGLLISADVNRTVEVSKKYPTFVFGLTTPLEQCLENVNGRRRARGKMEPVNPKNTKSKFTGAIRSCERIAEAGIKVFRSDYDSVFKEVCNILNV